MRGGRMALALASALVVTQAAEADQARRRGPGSTGGHSGHGSPGTGGVSRGVARQTPTQAQLRHPRAGTGTGYRYGYGRYRPYYGNRYPYYGYGYGYPYYGYYGYPFYGGYPYFGFSFRYGYPYDGGRGYYGSPYGYGSDGYASSSRAGSLRVQVEPEETKVYVDGYYSGVVDDFDGVFQRLRVSPGRHEITLKLDGYRTHHVRVYASPGETLDLRHDMVRGEGEDQGRELGEPSTDYARNRSETERAEPEPGREPAAESGTLRLDVVPPDATVYVDGEFHGVARELRRLRLAPGRHEVEVVRPGYLTQSRVVELRAGEERDLGIDLPRP